jgi:hypothetical protein
VPTTTGDLEEMPLLAGQGVGQVRDVRPAGDIVREMVDDAAAILFRLGVPGKAEGHGTMQTDGLTATDASALAVSA